MTFPVADDGWLDPKPTACLVLADGTVIMGAGCGATGVVTGEVCFNTAMTGYEEILTDPSYAGQIIAFTFPHIGNVGANGDDVETLDTASGSGVRGCILRAAVTPPSSWRAELDFPRWLEKRGIVAISGVDTRALTNRLRERGMINAALAHDPEGNFDIDALKAAAAGAPPMEGAELATGISTPKPLTWNRASWSWQRRYPERDDGRYRIVAFDYGIKGNILRLLTDRGASVTVLPATASLDDVLRLDPDGVFLSNGPGDPAATSARVVSTLDGVLDNGIPTFGICLGHQLLALALGAKTFKMHQGHHGANHPVLDFTTGKVEIVSMNHGFAVDPASLPGNAVETHRSLFDGSNAGLRLSDRPAFSVQYHPEASPGPQDSHYLFTRFLNLIRERRGESPEREHPRVAA